MIWATLSNKAKSTKKKGSTFKGASMPSALMMRQSENRPITRTWSKTVSLMSSRKTARYAKSTSCTTPTPRSPWKWSCWTLMIPSSVIYPKKTYHHLIPSRRACLKRMEQSESRGMRCICCSVASYTSSATTRTSWKWHRIHWILRSILHLRWRSIAISLCSLPRRLSHLQQWVAILEEVRTKGEQRSWWSNCRKWQA